MQKAITRSPFVPYGLAASRAGPEIPSDESRGRIKTYVRNWNQIAEYAAEAGLVGDPLTDLFFAMFASLREINEPVDSQGDVRYDRDPRERKEPGEWEGEPQPDTAHLALRSMIPSL